MCRPVLQCVLEVPAGTSSPNQSAKYELEVPAGTSKLIKVPASTSSFKQNRFQLGHARYRCYLFLRRMGLGECVWIAGLSSHS